MLYEFFRAETRLTVYRAASAKLRKHLLRALFLHALGTAIFAFGCLPDVHIKNKQREICLTFLNVSIKHRRGEVVATSMHARKHSHICFLRVFLVS